MNSYRPQRTHRGFVFITALYMTGVIALALLATVTQILTDVRSAKQYVEQTQVFQRAEAAIDVAIVEFASGGTDQTINFSQTEGWADSSSNPCSSGNSCLKTVSLVSGGTATVTVTDIGAAEPVITSNSSVGGRQQSVEVVIARPSTSPFANALFGEKSIVIGSSGLIDSYNSTLANGVYGGTISPADSKYGTLNKSDPGRDTSWNADIRTNSTEYSSDPLNPKGIDVGSSSNLYGDATVGPNGVPSDVINADGATIYGDQTAAGSNLDPQPPRIPSGSPSGSPRFVSGIGNTIDIGSCNCSSLILSSSTTLTLTGTGTLHLTSFQIGSSGAVDFNGDDITIVVDTFDAGSSSTIISRKKRFKLYGTGVGVLDFGSSSLVNTTSTPQDFMIYQKGGNTLDLGSSSTFYGAVYAPDARVNLGSSNEFFGSVVGKDVILESTSKFHYDEALASEKVETQGGTATVQSWRQP